MLCNCLQGTDGGKEETLNEQSTIDPTDSSDLVILSRFVCFETFHRWLFLLQRRIDRVFHSGSVRLVAISKIGTMIICPQYERFAENIPAVPGIRRHPMITNMDIHFQSIPKIVRHKSLRERFVRGERFFLFKETLRDKNGSKPQRRLPVLSKGVWETAEVNLS